MKRLSPADLNGLKIINVADAEAATDALTKQVAERGQRGLARWHAALADAANHPADLVWIGDSLTEGYRASSDFTRFQNLVAGELQKVFNPIAVPGGEGYIPSHHGADPAATTGNLANRWTYNSLPSVPTVTSYPNGFGLGRRYINMTSTTQSISITVWGDRLWLLFTRANNVGNAVITIDGGTPVTFDTYIASGVDSYAWDSGQLTRGLHTVSITISAGSTGGTVAYVEGLMVFDGDGGSTYNVGKGIRSWDAAMYGATAGSFVSSDYNLRPLDKIRPDLVMIGLIANDAGTGVALATYEANLSTLIDNVRSYSGVASGGQPPSICLWAPRMMGTTVSQATWDTYLASMQKVARTKGVGFFDSAAQGFPHGSESPEMYAADLIHYSDAGMAELARQLVKYLGGSFGIVKKQNAKGVVIHGSVASFPRPTTFGSVEWQGTVTPTNAIDGDTWIDTT